MTNNPQVEAYKALLAEIGKSALHALYPNDFEFYLSAFEIVDADSNLIDFFIFPIMPERISESERNLKNIKVTSGGITSLKKSNFNPRTINIGGTFGRAFKLLLGRDTVTATAVQINPDIREFSNQIKTGYGATKVLEGIYEKSKQSDSQGRPLITYFYNLAFGTAYVVEFDNIDFQQSIPGSNMVWNYSFSLQAIAPLRGFIRDEDYNRSLRRLLQINVVQKAAMLVVKDIAEALNL